jgi:hypothetical protein
MPDLTIVWKLLGAVPILLGAGEMLDALREVSSIVASVAATIGAIAALRANRHVRQRTGQRRTGDAAEEEA